ncbi:hypothetical protein MRB53_028713 [Persea americana]|uniref:Uncharacterized protein n=1 Tax=Persea americana TaxID=3435 RepID=A0ACC2KGD2_PERAE|nr:hypothetical protein MRB53_028713 [Persea americana]
MYLFPPLLSMASLTIHHWATLIPAQTRPLPAPRQTASLPSTEALDSERSRAVRDRIIRNEVGHAPRFPSFSAHTNSNQLHATKVDPHALPWATSKRKERGGILVLVQLSPPKNKVNKILRDVTGILKPSRKPVTRLV